MARSYRRVEQAESYLLRAKGIMEAVDVQVPASAWFALGNIRGLVDEAIGCLAAPASRASAEEYAAGVELMEGYVQDALFGEGARGGE